MYFRLLTLARPWYFQNSEPSGQPSPLCHVLEDPSCCCERKRVIGFVLTSRASCLEGRRMLESFHHVASGWTGDSYNGTNIRTTDVAYEYES